MKQFCLKVIGITTLVTLIVNCQTQKTTNKNTSSFRQILGEDTFKNWEGDPRFWSIEDDTIIGETSEDNSTEENTFLIWKKERPSDFIVKFEYRFVKIGEELTGNSGLQFRSERLNEEENSKLTYRVGGYQADFAVSDWIPGIHYEEKGRGILARRGQKVVINSYGEINKERFAEEDLLGEYIDHSEWNKYYIYANGDTLRASINDQLMHEIIDQSPEARQDGVLAFQIHTGPPMRVELRNVQLKTLN